MIYSLYHQVQASHLSKTWCHLSSVQVVPILGWIESLKESVAIIATCPYFRSLIASKFNSRSLHQEAHQIVEYAFSHKTKRSCRLKRWTIICQWSCTRAIRATQVSVEIITNRTSCWAFKATTEPLKVSTVLPTNPPISLLSLQKRRRPAIWFQLYHKWRRISASTILTMTSVPALIITVNSDRSE